MRPTISALIHFLNKSLEVIEFIIPTSWPKDRQLHLPLIHEDKMNDFVSGRVILLDNIEGIQCSGEQVYIWIGTAAARIEPLSLPGCHILLHPQHSLKKVLSVIQLCFEAYDNWEDALSVFCNEHRNPKLILEQSYLLLENPISLLDYELCYIASTDDKGSVSASHKATEQLQDNYYITQEHIAIIADDMSENEKKRIPFLYTNSQLPYQSIIANIYAEDAYLGSLGVTNFNRPFQSFDYEIIQRLSSALAEVMLKYYVNKQKKKIAVHEIICDILDGQLPAAPSGWETLKQIGLTRQSDCQLFYTCRPVAKRHIPLTYEGYRAEHLISGLFALEYRDGLYFLLIYNDMAQVPAMQSKLDNFLRSAGLRCGASELQHGIEGLVHAALQAEQALALSDAADGKCILPFAEVRLLFCMKQIEAAMPISHLVPLGMQKLLEHDQAGTVSYVETLFVYLTTGMNVRRSAQALHIQRNTFLARLERIQQMAGLDLQDADRRFYTELILRLMGYDTSGSAPF